MPKETAFGGESSYTEFKETGQRIGRTANKEAVEYWVDRLNSTEVVEVQRASAVCYAICDENPLLFGDHVEVIIDIIEKNTHDAGPRFAYRALNEIEIPEELQGKVIDLSFKAIADPNEPIAVRVFALSVISNHLEAYPDLKVELTAIIREFWPQASAGLKSRARKVIREHQLEV